MRLFHYALVVSLCLTAVACNAFAAEEDGSAPWPALLQSGDMRAAIYPPQLLRWQNNVLTQQVAVALELPDRETPVYGVAEIETAMRVDEGRREASSTRLQRMVAWFPADRTLESTFEAAFRRDLVDLVGTVTLDWLDDAHDIMLAKNAGASARPSNTPPAIVVATEPSLLVPVDGRPAWRAVPGTDLERAVNCPMTLVRTRSQRLYLRFLDGYLESSSLAGPWRIAAKAPQGMALAEKDAAENGEDGIFSPSAAEGRESGEGKAPDGPLSIKDLRGKTPRVHVADGPTELVLIEGAPRYEAVPGTDLSFVSNTTANLFLRKADNMHYVLLSGRWFRSSSLQGPWSHVPASELPAEFAAIPDASPKENVKASVPGTVQSAEARVFNAVPQLATVPRATSYTPRVDGEPRMRPVAGTNLLYAANAADPMILVPGDSWYAAHGGIWFTAAKSAGPWRVATRVAPALYGIPMSSPLHSVTYLRIYAVSDSSVLLGYTPGYSGVVRDGDSLVYGTGYAYTPWVGARWHPSPYSYGLGASPGWTPWDGWYFGFGSGYGWSGQRWGYAGPWGWWGYPRYPWWGPYRAWKYRPAPPPRAGMPQRHFSPRPWGPGGWAGTRPDFYHRGPEKPDPGHWRRPGPAYNPHTGAPAYGRPDSPGRRDRDAIAPDRRDRRAFRPIGLPPTPGGESFGPGGAREKLRPPATREDGRPSRYAPESRDRKGGASSPPQRWQPAGRDRDDAQGGAREKLRPPATREDGRPSRYAPESRDRKDGASSPPQRWRPAGRDRDDAQGGAREKLRPPTAREDDKPVAPHRGRQKEPQSKPRTEKPSAKKEPQSKPRMEKPSVKKEPQSRSRMEKPSAKSGGQMRREGQESYRRGERAPDRSPARAPEAPRSRERQASPKTGGDKISAPFPSSGGPGGRGGGRGGRGR